MKLSEFLIGQAKKVGYTIPEAILTTVPDYDVNDDVVRSVDNGLISISDAKNNHTEIKNHYHKQALDGADAILKEVMDANPELAEDEELKKESGTFKRIRLITNKIGALHVAKVTATGKKDNQQIQQQIDDLQAQLRTEKEARAKDAGTHQGALKEYKRNTQLGTLLGTRKTIHDTLPGNVRNTILNSLLGEELSAAGVQFDLDDQERLVIRRADGTNYYGENNTVVTPDAFIDKILAKHKQLVTSGQSTATGVNPQQQANGQQASLPVINAGENGNKNNGAATLRALNDQAFKDFQKGSEAHRSFAG